MEPLTKRQRQVLGYIQNFIADNGYAPSFREIAENFDLSSTGTVAEYITILENKGYLTKEATEARSIQLVSSDDDEEVQIPLLGLVAAGFPIEAVRTYETIDIPRDMMGRKTYALRVKGESMIEDVILDGDYVIIEQTPKPKNGDIVVALIDNDNTTLKRYYDEKSFVRLQPANSTLRPMRFPKKRLTIQGKVRGVIRKFV